MPFVSVDNDNQKIAAVVAEIQTAYSGFLSGLRGVVAETLSGVSNGLVSIGSISRDLNLYANVQESILLGRISSALRGASMSALAASEAFTGKFVSDNALLASDALVDGFTITLSDKLDRQMQRDVRTADTFVRKQLMQGRAFVSSDQLTQEVDFKMNDAAGRGIKSDDYITREVNWATRTVYNTMLIYSGSESGVEEFVVSGGSKEGEVLTIEDYEKKAGAIFHHNSKSLLQPH